MNSLPSAQETIGVAFVNAKDAIVDTVYPSEPTTSIPQPPHGQPPSEECHKGKVAYEDKTLTGKLSEKVENLQSSFSSLNRPSLDALIELRTTDPSTSVPQPPHGQPPSDSNSRGVVADEDKTYLTRVTENLPSVREYVPSVPLPSWSEYRQEINAYYESFPQNLSDTVNQAKRTIGLPTPGIIPPPPRGVPPSDESRGRVANVDKPIQVQLEENWEMLRSEFLNLWSQSKRKLGWNWVQPGTVPEPPRGIPPSNANSRGVVDDRDKTLTAVIDDSVMQFRDVAQKTVDEAIKEIKDTTQTVVAIAEEVANQSNRVYVGISSPPIEGSVPRPPHGAPPSESTHLGVVADQDKTFQQKAVEVWEQVKEVAKEKGSDKRQGLDNFAVGTSTSILTGGDL